MAAATDGEAEVVLLGRTPRRLLAAIEAPPKLVAREGEAAEEAALGAEE